MATPKVSIVSGAIARDLIADTKPKKGIFVGRRDATPGVRIDWTFRLCTENVARPGARNRWDRVTRLTGGAVLEGRSTERFEHAPSVFVGRDVIRLKPGWDEATVSRAVHRLHRRLGAWAIESREREAVYAVWEPIRESGVDVEPIVAEGEAAGHTSEYDKMNAADREYWLKRAEAFVTASPAGKEG